MEALECKIKIYPLTLKNTSPKYKRKFERNHPKDYLCGHCLASPCFIRWLLATGYWLLWFGSAESLKNFALNMGWTGFLLNNIVAVIPCNLPGLAMFQPTDQLLALPHPYPFLSSGPFLCYLISG